MLDRCPNCGNNHPGTEIYQCPVCKLYQCDLPFPPLDMTVTVCGSLKTSCDRCDQARRYSKLEEVAKIKR
jgi:hypothetical protein